MNTQQALLSQVVGPHLDKSDLALRSVRCAEPLMGLRLVS